MNSNTTEESSSGRRLTSGEQHTTSIDADRTVFTDRDGRELSLVRVSDGAELPFLGYTESTVAWGTSPTRSGTHAGHVSIDVSGAIPEARYYPRTGTVADDAPHSVSLTARIVTPVEAGYEDAPFVVRLLTEEFVTARHGSLLPPAYDLVYHSLGVEVATDGGSAFVPAEEQATDAEVREAVEAAEDKDEWNPEPAALRDGEVPDVDSHAARNLAQLKQGLDDGLVEPSDLSADQRQQLDVEEAAEADGTQRLVTDGGDEMCPDCGGASGGVYGTRMGRDVLICEDCGLRFYGASVDDRRVVTDGGVIHSRGGDVGSEPGPLSMGNEVYDRDREQFGEVVEVLEDAHVGGGRVVDRLRIRWDSGADEWFHREWLTDGTGRDIVRVEQDGGRGTGEVAINVNE
jgi:hypothetical protein